MKPEPTSRPAAPFAGINLCNELVRELDFSEQCRFARELGFAGLEVAPFTLSGDPHLVDGRQARSYRAMAEAEGVCISGLHWLLAAPEGLSITTDDDTVRDRTMDVGRRLVDLCAELGGTYLVHGSPGQRRLDPGREADGRRRATAYFAAMAEAAASAGVTYLLEPLAPQDSDMLNSVDEACDLIAEVGAPGLATMIDCCAAARSGDDVPALLRKWLPGGKVRHVHLNDPNGMAPGEGDLSFGPIMEVLGAHPEISLGLEPFIYTYDGRASAARAMGYLRGVSAPFAARGGAMVAEPVGA